MHAPRQILAVLALSTVLAAASSSAAENSWELPVSLGQSDEQVQQLLGAPNEVVDFVREKSKCKNPICMQIFSPGDSEEWYYSSGIVANYQRGRLFRVTLYHHADYKGFLPHPGKIVDGISLNDSREKILHKLGDPTKVEENEGIGDDLRSETKAGPDVPSVWPDQETYYWRRQHYTIEVLFLKQPKSVDKKRGIVLPKGEVMYVKVYQ